MRIRQPLLALALPLLSNPMTVGAAFGQNSIGAGSVIAQAGDIEVTVPISATIDQRLTLLSAEISFDEDLCDRIENQRIRRAGRTNADPEEGGIDCPQEGRARIIILDLFGGTAIPAGTGPIAEWVFDVRADAPRGVFPVEIEVEQARNGPLEVDLPELIDGQLTIVGLADHYVLYKVVASKREDLPGKGQFPKKDYNLKLDDVILPNSAPDDPENYQVKKELSLALPAMKNDEPGPRDRDLHYLRYRLTKTKEGAGAFDPAKDRYPKAAKHDKRIWVLRNQLGTINVQSTKVEALWVPAAKDVGSLPPPPPDATHYVCYSVKPTKDITDQTPDNARGKGIFRKDLEAFFGDQFLDEDCAVDKDAEPSFPGTMVAGKCLFKLNKPTSLCNPVAKDDVGGSPPRLTIAPPGSISTPTASESFLCYGLSLVGKVKSEQAAALAQLDVGTRLKQRKHAKRDLKSGTAPHTQPGNRFPAPLQVDTKKPEAACLPTEVISIAPVQ